MKYANKNQRMVQNQAQRQKSGRRQILFLRKESQPKKSKEDIIFALNCTQEYQASAWCISPT